MAEETRFRILNKTRETVTLKLQDKPMTFSWEEFNKKLIVVDKVSAILNEDEMNRSGIHRKKYRGGKPNRDKDGNCEVVSTVDNKPTFGDAFSCLGELKEKMEKE